MSKHYYRKPPIICYSGGKDSDVILHLALDYLKPSDFEVMYSITTIDSFITTTHINNVFKEIEKLGVKTIRHFPIDRNGEPTNMWKLIAKKQIPPTRFERYCCSILKETSTTNRIAILGVRHDESKGRTGRDTFGLRAKKKSDATFYSLEHTLEVFSESKEHESEEYGDVWDCTLIKNMKQKNDIVVNLIYGWSDYDVWDYLRENGYKYNPMYDMGYDRCGCIGCPLSSRKNRLKEFADFPYAKELYIKAFDEMLKVRREAGKDDSLNRDGYHKWETGEDVFEWWMETGKYQCKGQIGIEDYLNDME